MNLFFRELKANRKSLILWCIGILLMVAGGMSKFGGVSSSGQSMNELMEAMPKALQAIMGTGSLDISTAGGYYGILFLYLMVMGAIHASMLGSTIVSKEERDKTVEFLLVKPISRNKVITWKLIAALVNVLIFNIVTFISSAAVVEYYNDGKSLHGDIALLLAGMFILQLIFLFLGTAIASAARNPKAAGSVSTAILMGTFLLSIIIDISSSLDFLKYLTPFKYFEAKQVMFGEGLDRVFLILSAFFIFIFLFVTYKLYKVKDMTV
ncbi:ABC-2 type transport system permease protein [Cytobacillus oceanisediminis]|jgi:ABC-2 type transport system permease protein|uniref:ABC-2 type transport system permease protein n=1 Tax=Cytobacillus oceanisediminis TaxID=665099 RepID=A0A2V2ZKN7_9BACI|nr:ABC transporter permease subunit [Cytobacillus oceanisediminis]PWW17421.1 ABC-2 type transport system permease protein [Cytobacillus oceanisediminis]